MRIQIYASLFPQRERRVKSEGRSPSSPEGTPVVFVDRYLEKHITPVTLKSNIKRNPLFMAIRSLDTVNNMKSKPSWTVKEYDTQTMHSNLADYLKVISKKDCGWLRGWIGVWGTDKRDRQMDSWINEGIHWQLTWFHKVRNNTIPHLLILLCLHITQTSYYCKRVKAQGWITNWFSLWWFLFDFQGNLHHWSTITTIFLSCTRILS